MTPLDGLQRLLRERLLYHAEQLTQPGEDPAWHNAVIHGLLLAMRMADNVIKGQKYE